MSSESKPRWFLQIGLWFIVAMMIVAIPGGTIALTFLAKARGTLAWEDAVTTGVGLWMLACIPISLMRWLAVPKARYGKMLTGPVIMMGAGGLSMLLPVLSEGRIDPAFAFCLVLVLFTAQAVITVVINQNSDELMRRYNADSTVIASAVLLGAFSIYAAGERLGVIGTISPWGLVGIACLIQFTVAMYVYYRLGMNPEAQEKAMN